MNTQYEYHSNDSDGEKILFVDGPHRNHKALVFQTVESCGAYFHDVFCECGANYANSVNGCWQYNHKRKQSGDTALVTSHCWQRTDEPDTDNTTELTPAEINRTIKGVVNHD